jgi:hypothetical protein
MQQRAKSSKSAKLIYILSAALFSLLLVGFGAYFYLKDRLLQLLIQEANRSLAVKVETGKIRLTFWGTFPQIAIRFDSVTIHGSLASYEPPLAQLEYLYVGFNLRKLWNKEYAIESIIMRNGQVNVHVDEAGKTNYAIVKTTENEADTAKIKLALNKVKVEQIDIRVDLRPQRQAYTLHVQKALAGIAIVDAVTNVDVSLIGKINSLAIEGKTWVKDKEVELNTSLVVDNDAKKVSLAPSTLMIAGAAFTCNGYIAYGANNDMEVNISAKESDLKVLTALMPNDIAQVVNQYKAKGKLAFSGSILRGVKEKGTPRINFSFTADNLHLTSPDGKAAIAQSYFKGAFTNGSLKNAETSRLSIDQFRALFDGNPVEGSLQLSNLADPHLMLNFKGLLFLKTLISFSAIQDIYDVSGALNTDLSFEGKLKDLSDRKTVPKVKAGGKFTLIDAGWRLKNKEFALSAVNGSFVLNKKDLSIDKLTCRIGSSDIYLHGAFRNVMGYLLEDDTDFELDADLKSSYMNLEELLAVKNAYDGNNAPQAAATSNEPYLLRVKPKWKINLNCDIQSFRFERFRPKRLQGVLTLEDARAYLENVQMFFGGGRFSISSKLDLRKPEYYTAWCRASWEQIPIDSVFYATYNFNQDFLKHDNIKGKMRGSATFELAFNDRLDVFPDKVKADIDMTITEGELIKFAPMMQLSKFLKKADLANLKFDVLTNTFHIEDELVLMPQMVVKSNAFEVTVAGNHNFKQHMDYRLMIPMRNFRKSDKDEVFGEIKEEESADGNLHLTMKGYPDNLKVAIDKEKIKTRIQERVEKEKQAIKDIFKNLKKKDQSQVTKPDKKVQEKEEETEFIEF